MQTRKTKPTRDRQSGVVAVVVALLIGVMFTFLAFILNIAHALDTRAQLLRAADAAALAGAADLDGTPAGITSAVASAEKYMEQHLVDKLGIQIDPTNDIEIGCWDVHNAEPGNKWSAFTVYSTSNASTCNTVFEVNAVRVSNGRDGVAGHNSAVETFFSAFLSRQTMNVSSEAVAIGGGPCESPACTLPLVISDCKLAASQSGAISCAQGVTAVFKNDSQDGIGFTNFTSSGGVNDNDAANLITTGGCRKVDANIELKMQNGNGFNKTADAINDMNYIGVWTALPVLKCDQSEWSKPLAERDMKFNKTAPIAGFVRIKIRAACGANKAGAAKGNHGDVSLCPGQRALVYDIGCDDEPTGGTTGCSSFGTVAPNLQIVR